MKTIIKHVTHHYRAMHAFHSFFFPSWCHGVRSPMVFRFVVPRGTHPKGLVSWCQGVHNPTIFHFIVPRSTQHKGLVAWCSGVCIPRVFSSPFCFIYILELSWHIIILSILSHTYALINIMYFSCHFQTYHEIHKSYQNLYLHNIL
jgi:hypothetical protein